MGARSPARLEDVIGALEPETSTFEGTPIPLDVWRELVGTRIADRSRPTRLDQDGTLLVCVPSSVWAQELSLLSSPILERLGSLGFHVRQLRFFTGKVRPPRRAPTRVERRRVAAPIPLPGEVQELVDTIEDEDLRGAIATAAASSLATAEALQRDEAASKTRRKRRQRPRGSD